jgi:hypothetical protein
MSSVQNSYVVAGKFQGCGWRAPVSAGTHIVRPAYHAWGWHRNRLEKRAKGLLPRHLAGLRGVRLAEGDHAGALVQLAGLIGDNEEFLQRDSGAWGAPGKVAGEPAGVSVNALNHLGLKLKPVPGRRYPRPTCRMHDGWRPPRLHTMRGGRGRRASSGIGMPAKDWLKNRPVFFALLEERRGGGNPLQILVRGRL